MASSPPARPAVLAPSDGEALWFLGNYVRLKLDGTQTGGRLAVFDSVFPRGAAPPLHSHPQDETFFILDGEVTVWVVEPELAARGGDPPHWVAERSRPCAAGALVYAPGGTAHTFRVESDTARMLTLSTPAGIEQFVRDLAEPARWTWLPPPVDGERLTPERVAAVASEQEMVVHGPPPPAWRR